MLSVICLIVEVNVLTSHFGRYSVVLGALSGVGLIVGSVLAVRSSRIGIAITSDSLRICRGFHVTNFSLSEVVGSSNREFSQAKFMSKAPNVGLPAGSTWRQVSIDALHGIYMPPGRRTYHQLVIELADGQRFICRGIRARIFRRDWPVWTQRAEFEIQRWCEPDAF